MLKRFTTTLATHYDISDVLYGVADHTTEVLSATCAGVSLADDEQGLRFAASSSDLATEIEAVQQATRQGPCYEAFETSQAVIVDKVADRDDWPEYRDAALRVGLNAMLGIPMMIKGRRLGAVNIYNAEPRRWDDDDIEVAWVFANKATSYVIHASRYAEAQRVNEQLQHALNSRIVIEQAKGILAGELGIDLDAAFQLLRRHARDNNANIHLVAEAVVKLGLRPAAPRD